MDAKKREFRCNGRWAENSRFQLPEKGDKLKLELRAGGGRKLTFSIAGNAFTLCAA
jgi:hypothetical protein